MNQTTLVVLQPDQKANQGCIGLHKGGIYGVIKYGPWLTVMVWPCAGLDHTIDNLLGADFGMYFAVHR